VSSTRVCSEPGCPNLQPCELHVRKAWTKTSARNLHRTSGNGWAQQRERQAVLKRDGHRCTWHDEHGHRCSARATVVDHVVAMADGGTDDRANKASLCGPHHDVKSAAERARGRRRQAAGGGVPPLDPL
jgi:5-methylcytosine-specific restriction enzyme A